METERDLGAVASAHGVHYAFRGYRLSLARGVRVLHIKIAGGLEHAGIHRPANDVQ